MNDASIQRIITSPRYLGSPSGGATQRIWKCYSTSSGCGVYCRLHGGYSQVKILGLFRQSLSAAFLGSSPGYGSLSPYLLRYTAFYNKLLISIPLSGIMLTSRATYLAIGN